MHAPPHPRFVAVLAAALIALVNTGCRPKDPPADLAWCPHPLPPMRKALVTHAR